MKNIIGTSESVHVNSITPLAQRAMFWRPLYLEQSAWLEHIPFAFWLVEAHHPRVLVELGAHYGVSYFAFCQAVDRLGLDTRCFAVDSWKGDEHSGLYDERVYEKVRAHNDAQYSGFSSLVRSSFDDALRHFEDASIDLLHIDGLHTLEAVRHDFESWLPKLSSRAIVIMHDTNVRERDFGVFKLFDSLKEQYPHFEFVHGHGLGVLGVGAEQSEILKRLFQEYATEHTRQALHEVFARLGRACADSLAAIKHQERAKQLAGEIEKQKKQLDEFRQLLDKTKADLNNSAKEIKETKSRFQNQIEQHAVERGHLAERVSLLQELRAELKEDVARLNARVETSSNELAEKSRQLTALSRQTSEYQQQVNAANEHVNARDRSIAELVDKLNDRVAEVQTLNQTLAQLKAESNRLTSLLAERDQALSFAHVANEAARADEQEKARVQIKQFEATREQLEQENRTLLADKQELAKSLKERFNELDRLTKMLEEEKQCTRQLNDALQTLSAARADTEAARYEEQEKAQAQIKQLEGSHQQLEQENRALLADKQAKAKSLEDRFRELGVLTKMLEEREASLKANSKELVEQQRRISNLDNEVNIKIKALKAAEKQLAETKTQAGTIQAQKDALTRLEVENKKLKSEQQAKAKSLEDRFRELGMLTKMLEEEKQRTARLTDSLSWKLTAPVRALAQPFKVRKKSRAIKSQIKLIEQSGLFDKSWYLSQYPDVAKSGANPVEHYIRRGAVEGRNPGPTFDTKWYLKTYIDVAESGVNPLVHYIKHGKNEGRAISHRRQGNV